MTEKEGLYDKYKVYKADTDEEVKDVFVLRLSKDKAAREAVLKYADCIDNEILAWELRDWVMEFEDYKCIDNRRSCDKINSPVCCCYCKLRNECFDKDWGMCYLVRSGEVLDIEECKYFHE